MERCCDRSEKSSCDKSKELVRQRFLSGARACLSLSTGRPSACAGVVARSVARSECAIVPSQRVARVRAPVSQVDDVSAVHRFATARPPGADGGGGAAAAYPTSLVVLGDMGQTAFSNATCDEIAAHRPASELAVFVGDLSYADGDGARWDAWGRLVERCFAELPTMVMPGNHEVGTKCILFLENACFTSKNWPRYETGGGVI